MQRNDRLTSARASTGHTKTIKHETEEQRIARLYQELDDLYNEQDDIEKRITALEQELAPYEVPFAPDDIAQTERGVRVKVLEVSPAFDGYVCRVVYVDNKGNPKDGKVYTFDANDLTAVGK